MIETIRGAAARQVGGDARTTAMLALILAVGAIVRSVGIAREALWSDEAQTLVISQWPVWRLLFTPVDPSPALYYLLVKGLVPANAGLFAARAISLAAGFGTILAVHAIGRISLSRRAGLLGAALVALSPPLIEYSQEGRPYALLILLVSLGVLGLVWTERRMRERRSIAVPLALFAAATLLSFYTHLVSIFWIFPAVIAGREVTRRRGTAEDARRYLWAAGAMLLLAIPEVLRIQARVGYGGFDWLAQLGPMKFLGMMGVVITGSGEKLPMAWVTLALAALIGWRLWIHRRALVEKARQSPALYSVTAALCAAPVGVWLLGYVITPIAMPRTVLIGMVGLILLLVIVAELERSRLAAGLMLLAFTGALAIAGATRPKDPWGPVARLLERQVAPGDVILLCPGWNAPTLMHPLAGRVSAPLLFVVGGRMILVPAMRPGQDWARLMFKPAMEMQVDYLAGRSDFTSWPARAMPPPRRFWLVEVDCSVKTTALIREWLGKGSVVRLVDRLPGGRAPIDVSTITAAPNPRPVVAME